MFIYLSASLMTAYKHHYMNTLMLFKFPVLSLCHPPILTCLVFTENALCFQLMSWRCCMHGSCCNFFFLNILDIGSSYAILLYMKFSCSHLFFMNICLYCPACWLIYVPIHSCCLFLPFLCWYNWTRRNYSDTGNCRRSLFSSLLFLGLKR